MPIDLTRARELVQKSEPWQLDDKLEKAYDEPLGEVFWALHKAGALDCSTRDAWWSDMTDATDCYDAHDVVALLLAAGQHPVETGLLDDHGRSRLAWNIYCRIFVKETIRDGEVLVAGMRQAPEPMRTPWALELAVLGKLDASEMPEGAVDRLASSAVAEVGGQRLYEQITQVFPVEAYAPALNAAAAAPGLDLWSLDFLATCADHATPLQLAGMVLNIDYSDTVPEMLEIMDRYPDGLEEALTQLVRDGRGYTSSGRYGDAADGDFGLATACTWIGKRAIAEGRELDALWTRSMLEAAEKNDAREHLAAAFAAIPLEPRASWILAQWTGYFKPWPLVPSTPTEAVARRVVQEVAGFKARDLNRVGKGERAALAALGQAVPGPLAEALGGKKLVARELLAEGLGHATDPEVAPVLARCLGDSKEAVRDAAVRGLVHLGAFDALARALGSRKRDTRLAAAQGLTELDDPRRRELAKTALAKESDGEITRLLEPMAGAEPTGPVGMDIASRRERLTDDQKAVFDEAWKKVRWEDAPPASLAAGLAEALGDDVQVATYDGLYRNRGRTRDKLALWHAVLDLAPVDDDMASLAVQMLAGWPLFVEKGYDDTPQLHTAAIEDAWRRVRERFGDAARREVLVVLDANDDAGLSAAWRFALRGGYPECPGLVHHTATHPDGAAWRLGQALAHLGDAAWPGVRSALADKKAAVREAAASALLADPRAELAAELAAIEERSAKVRAVLARAGFACAGVGAAPLDSDPDLDSRLAAWPGEVPRGCTPAELPRLAWADGTPLSDGAFRWVLSRLGEERHDRTDGDLQAVRARWDRVSASALLAALRKTFDKAKEARNGWVLFATAHLADDAEVTRFGEGLDDEARYGSSAVAFYKITVLGRHGAPGALTWVDHWARNARSQGLQARAEQCLDDVAAARDTTPDALADELVSDFGLDGSGERTLAYGSRQLTLVLQPGGDVGIRRPDGKIVKSVPRPLAADRADEVAAQKRTINALRKQLGQALEAATERLEQAMVTGRRWDEALFGRTWGDNPLLAVPGRGVWWGWFGRAGVVPVRLGLDGLVDASGDALSWPEGASIGVIHPLELDEATRAALLASALPAPFRQLDRPTFDVAAGDAAKRQIDRYEDAAIGTGRLRGHLERRRWVRGEPQDAGHVAWYSKAFPRADLTAKLEMEPGFSIGGWDGSGDQAIPSVEFTRGLYGRDDLPWRIDALKLGEVDPIVYSEVVADLQAVAPGM